MTTYVGAAEAARLLGVTLPTLYAYVSRGRVTRRLAADGRSSLFSLDELDALRQRSRAAPAGPRPSLDVQIVTSVTALHDGEVTYRGHPVEELAVSSSFEQVAELLWTGTRPDERPTWPEPSPDAVQTCRAVVDHAGTAPLPSLGLLATVLAERHPTIGSCDASRLLITLAPGVLGPVATTERAVPSVPSVAAAVAAAWHPEPSIELVAAIDRALVVLADHELATSTLAVRLAGSVRADPFTAYAAGLAVLHSPLHGSAAPACARLLERCRAVGARTAVREALASPLPLVGFGHAVSRGRDPRVATLLEAVRALPDPHGNREVVDELLAEAGRRVTALPNVDLALGALHVVGGLPPDVPLFALARLAGWAAHLDEELGERPLRFRGRARPTAELGARPAAEGLTS